MSELSDRCLTARRSLGKTQAEIALAIGISRAAYAQWENGHTKSINSTVLFRASRSLNVDPEWLATGDSCAGNDQNKIIGDDDDHDLLSQMSTSFVQLKAADQSKVIGYIDAILEEQNKQQNQITSSRTKTKRFIGKPQFAPNTTTESLSEEPESR